MQLLHIRKYVLAVFEFTQLQMKRLNLPLCIVWILPSNERGKLGCDVDYKLVLVFLKASRAYPPRLNEVIYILTIRLLTLGCCESSQAGYSCFV
jgi:hypothetical protein